MLKPIKEGDQISLVNEDGSKKFPLDDEVWKALRTPDILMPDFVKVIQAYTLKVNRDWAGILKEECPDNDAYRDLRSSIRLSGLA